MLSELARPWGHSLALVGVVFVAVLARADVLFGASYAPGADYGHALLFAEQIRSLGDIPSVFPFHQLGLTEFHSSPGLPLELLALDAATGVPALRLTGFALVFSGIGVFGMYLLGKVIAGAEFGVLAALIYALLPANLEMLGWAGYSNIYALALTPFLFWALARVRGGFDHRFVWLAALLASAIALVHLLTAILVGAAALIAAALDLALSKDRARLWKLYLYLLGAAATLSLPAVALSVRTQLTSGDTLGFWSLSIVEVTRPGSGDYLRFFSGFGLALALVGLAAIAVRRFERSLALWLTLALLLISAAVAYSWILGFSFYYERALYFLAIPLSVLIAYALWSVRWPAGRVGLAAVIVGTMSVGAFHAARDVTRHYSILNSDSLSAMEWVKSRTSPDDVVVSDGCLAFLWEFVGQRPTAAAFTPIQLTSAQEEVIAADARRMLQSRAASADLIESYGVSYLLYDADCPSFNPSLVFDNLEGQPNLKRAATFGTVYVYEALK